MSISSEKENTATTCLDSSPCWVTQSVDLARLLLPSFLLGQFVAGTVIHLSAFPSSRAILEWLAASKERCSPVFRPQMSWVCGWKPIRFFLAFLLLFVILQKRMSSDMISFSGILNCQKSSFSLVSNLFSSSSFQPLRQTQLLSLPRKNQDHMEVRLDTFAASPALTFFHFAMVASALGQPASFFN